LVRPGIRLHNTMSGSVLDSNESVIEKFGVRPDQIIDYLALMGDTVDNVPGVEKCGPKTAAKWLAEYNNMENVVANADKISGKIGENLRAALPRLPLNKLLVTIKTDVVLEQAPEQLILRDKHLEELKALYTRLGFNSALKELTGAATPDASVKPTGSARFEHETPAASLSAPGVYDCVLTQDQLNLWRDKCAKADIICIDTETDALDSMQANLVGISLCVETGSAAYIPIAHRFPGAPEQLGLDAIVAALKPILEDPSKAKVGQHGKYDLHVLRRHGIQLQGYSEDTMLESFILTAGIARHDMDTLAQKYLGYQTIKFEDVCGKGAKQISFADVDLQRATAYAAEDADITLRLHQVLSEKLHAMPSLQSVYRDIEMPLVPVLTRIEANGILIDADELKRQSTDLSQRMHTTQLRAFEISGRHFNLDSPKQVGALLFDELKLPALVKTPTGAPSTNEEALEAIADQHELPRLILDYRGMAKLRSTYTEKLPEMINPKTGRVHTSYHQAGAATGRLSSNDPNLQNIPIRSEDGRRIRKAFIAPAGRVLVACDYSQIELRIMAHLSEDAGLVNAFASGIDVHKATAAEVFGVAVNDVSGDQRRAAKAINFGLMYGMSAFGLAKQLGIGRGEAQDYIALYFSRYPGVREFMERIRGKAREEGFVETVFGRRLYLQEINSRNQAQRSGAERAAINAPMQGTAADIIKRAMITVDAWLASIGYEALMLLQVHDELVFECDKSFAQTLSAQVKQRMEAAAELRVPLVVDIGVGENWDEAH
jgi:DNA polymerase I